MTGRVVLNTRPRDQAAELSRLLEADHFVCIEAPAIAILSAWDGSVLEHTKRALSSFTWVVLASRNAAHGLEDALDRSNVACGAATATALGIRPEISLSRFSAAAALEALRSHIAPGDRVLVPRAAEGRDELVDGLRALGAVVEAPIAYRTVAVADATDRLRAGGIDVVTLCSPSAVTSVKNALSSELVACLGGTTATTALDLGLRVDAVASSTSMASLVEAVHSALGARV